MNNWRETTQKYTEQLMGFNSETDMPGERDFGGFLRDILAQWSYFQQHPQDLRLEPTLNDAHERYFVAARVGGQGPQTLILTGHYDVVSIENYGTLKEWAGNPQELLPRLVAELEQADDLAEADRLALEDLRSGAFLPGRGALDMKSGLAAGMVVLERYAQLPLEQRPGNLVFIAVPDEETASHGARSVAQRLPELAQEWAVQAGALEWAGAINLDASDDHGDGTLGQAAYLGSVGKLLPAVYLVGRDTHAGSPFSGVNAALLASELTRRVECNPELVDANAGEFTVPPVCLKQADTKPRYNVTTPSAVWCYYNWLTYTRPAGDVLQRMVELAQEALLAAQTKLEQAASDYAKITKTIPNAGHSTPPQVYRFSEVDALARQRGGMVFQNQYAALEDELSRDPALDAPTVALKLAEFTWQASGLSGPAAVVGFAALYYPPVALEAGHPAAERLQAAIQRQAQAIQTDLGVQIGMRPYFPGISDLSFLGSRVTPSELDDLQANSPAWRSRTGFDYAQIASLHLPVVNIGPWGRDYHQRTERVHMGYAFEVLPEYLWRIAEDILSQSR